MKEILVDLYKIKNMYSGLGQFSMNFAKELSIQLPENLKLNFLIPKSQELEFTDKNTNVIKANFQKQFLPILNKNYFIWHSLQQFPTHFPNRNSRLVLTIHDLNFLLEKSDAKSLKYLKRLQKNVDRANCITTISNYTKEQIEANLNLKGKKIHVIYNGIASNIGMKKTIPKFVNQKKFFFSIGIFNKKKNFHTLIALMKHFENYQLVIAGNNDSAYGKYVQAEVDRLNLNDRIVLPGKISESDKLWLYANCEAFLFPSLAEGFGMPVIEAMNEGKPVFLSKFTSLPEIGGKHAFYFDNFDELHMTNIIRDKLHYISSDQEKFKIETKKYAEKFNWSKCINAYLKLYKQIE